MPVSFLKPADLIESPRVFAVFNLGKYTISINQTIVNTWVLMILAIIILVLGTRNLSVDNPKGFQLLLEEYYKFIENTF